MSDSPATAGERGISTERLSDQLLEQIRNRSWISGPCPGIPTQAEADRSRLIREVDRLRAENERLRACVKAADMVRFYAKYHLHDEDGSNGNCTGCGYLRAFDKARAGLEVE